MLVPTLLELGTEEQKQKYIEPTLTGEMVWCQGYSNPVPGLTLPLAHIGGFGGRSFCGQRPENMDEHGGAGGYDFLPGAHRTRCAQASGHQLSAVFDGYTGIECAL